jgi:hypothetical protein
MKTNIIKFIKSINVNVVYLALAFIGLFDMLCSQNKHELIIPCIASLSGIVRLCYSVWIENMFGIVFGSYKFIVYEITFTMYLISINMLAVYKLLHEFPGVLAALIVSVFFHIVMVNTVIKLFLSYRLSIHSMIRYIDDLDIFEMRSNEDRLNKPGFNAKWIIPHQHDEKVDDVCLLCLEHLQDNEYVHVSVHVMDNQHVCLSLHVTNIITQCSMCKCTLHLACCLSIADCPVCKMNAR